MRKLDLPYIEPELREDMGEFAAAEKNELPRLIQWTDIERLAAQSFDVERRPQPARRHRRFMEGLGLDYWAITDHSKASFQANGLDAVRLREQMAEIKKINSRFAQDGKDFRLLMGMEVDIVKNGLDLDDDLLSELEVVVASLHVPFER